MLTAPKHGHSRRQAWGSAQCPTQVVDQHMRLERLGQETQCTAGHGSLAHCFFGKSRDEKGGNMNILCRQILVEFNATHVWHLHVGNQAADVIQLGSAQELLGRRKDSDLKTQRTNKTVEAVANGGVIIDNGDQRRTGQTEYLCRCESYEVLNGETTLPSQATWVKYTNV